MERVQKVISNLGYASRREAEKLIIDGKVLINDKIASLGDKVSNKDIIKINGVVIDKKNNDVKDEVSDKTEVIDIINDEKSIMDDLSSDESKKDSSIVDENFSIEKSLEVNNKSRKKVIVLIIGLLISIFILLSVLIKSITVFLSLSSLVVDTTLLGLFNK